MVYQGWMLIKLILHLLWLSFLEFFGVKFSCFNTPNVWFLMCPPTLPNFVQSTLLGLSCPINSVGNLPLDYIELNEVSFCNFELPFPFDLVQNFYFFIPECCSLNFDTFNLGGWSRSGASQYETNSQPVPAQVWYPLWGPCISAIVHVHTHLLVNFCSCLESHVFCKTKPFTFLFIVYQQLAHILLNDALPLIFIFPWNSIQFFYSFLLFYFGATRTTTWICYLWKFSFTNN